MSGVYKGMRRYSNFVKYIRLFIVISLNKKKKNLQTLGLKSLWNFNQKGIDSRQWQINYLFLMGMHIFDFGDRNNAQLLSLESPLSNCQKLLKQKTNKQKI